MALTPENVINKGFKFTKYTKGYSMEEVDDFLDEVVVEFRRLNAENASLKRQLEETEAKLAAAEEAQSQVLDSEIVGDATPAASPATAAPVAEPVPVAAPAASQTPAPDNAASLLAMAQKVHDDYVAAGKAEKERMVGEARSEATSLVADARTERNRVLGELDQTKKQLEISVDNLRNFEKQYREGLRHLMESNLKELESTPSIEPQQSTFSRQEF
ncbi:MULTISPECIES: DivIVA domain-containing protein [unclassified Rothia (in: high G+C Gram-positive bacteria)]|uniref:DivIVA domain-containing protein n=1 Tax=unclassified Rothia (in: high G+C Gram-positive bacteria) TaxID=2689056 RepID=UPI00195EE51D|nr:DivIVA domain-containing protein [Rothia sp. ZJ932]MBM7050749.1 DivIVA domain-containing protein [Rothia sp. ZJ1223]QRZ60930.1 DivIVA domain-containing protein [Rothia sp. ZJ932]